MSWWWSRDGKQIEPSAREASPPVMLLARISIARRALLGSFWSPNTRVRVSISLKRRYGIRWKARRTCSHPFLILLAKWFVALPLIQHTLVLILNSPYVILVRPIISTLSNTAFSTYPRIWARVTCLNNRVCRRNVTVIKSETCLMINHIRFVLDKINLFGIWEM